ncbi:hypothetical protein AU106_gp015 [Sinorhizobium phage phiM9]|uniref:Uncharacterized protein n=1 Tax=Sinorhizobium phage phiM9 TaxID=1636182 RepID=A0A0F6TH26_9CAUD|nr:hypothetical protein AU106_gp015 [Sinorhizobium phage phiM9]AKE44646.1 hypothetical protein Sm_phiM9_016 [Sinorhizobium phage phiM9]
MAIKKENALPLASIIACIGTAFALWAGVFDRGATSGSLTEKVAHLENSISKAQDWINTHIKGDELKSQMYQEIKIDIVRLQEQMATIKSRIAEIEADVRERERKR